MKRLFDHSSLSNIAWTYPFLLVSVENCFSLEIGKKKPGRAGIFFEL